MANLPARLPASGNGPITLPPRLQASALEAASQPYGSPVEAPRDISDAARAALPGIVEATKPASPQDRLAILFALADMVGKPDVMRNGTRASQEIYWRKYHELLAHIPADVLSRACDAFLIAAPHSGQSKWFPDPGTLLQHARADDRWTTMLKMKKGLDILSKARPSRGEMDNSEEAWAAVGARLAAMSRRFKDEDRCTT